MHKTIRKRLRPINFKNTALVKGDIVVTSSGTLQGLMFYDLSDLREQGIDTTNVACTIYTPYEYAIMVKAGDLIEVNEKYLHIDTIQFYRDPFGPGYGTSVIIVKKS